MQKRSDKPLYARHTCHIRRVVDELVVARAHLFLVIVLLVSVDPGKKIDACECVNTKNNRFRNIQYSLCGKVDEWQGQPPPFSRARGITVE